MEKKCLFCKKSYHLKPCLEHKSKFCCRNCKNNYYKGKHISPISEFKTGIIPWNKGKNNIYSLEIRKMMSLSKLGKKRNKKTIEQRLHHSLGALKGNLCHFWKGGVTKPNEKLRRSIEYKLWRLSVYERDNFTCQMCGQRGVRLNADHIKSYALFPKLRFDINNGQTLCLKCHAIKTKEDMKYIAKEVRSEFRLQRTTI